MTQIAPFLKPGKDAPDAASPSDGVERNALNQPRLPLAGFWRRIGAVVFDLILLYFVARLAGSLFSDQLLKLGQWSGLFGLAVTALYFALGNGPVGKGRTVGKLLTGIRTTTLDGGTPGFGQALARFAILYSGVLYAAIAIPLMKRPDEFSTWYSVQWAIPPMTLFAMLVANIFAVVFNPFKQTLHDHAARTLVRPLNAPTMSLEEIGGIVGGNWKRYYRQPQVTGWATFILVTGCLLLLSTRGDVPESFSKKYALEQSLIADDWFEDLHMQAVVMPTADDLASDETRRAWLANLYDEASTDTLHMQVTVQRPGAWDTGDPDLYDRMEMLATRYHEEITAVLPPQSFARDSPEGVAAQGLRTRPLVYDVVLLESISLGFPSFIFQEEAARFEFPLPPLEKRSEPAAENNPEGASPAPETPVGEP